MSFQRLRNAKWLQPDLKKSTEQKKRPTRKPRRADTYRGKLQNDRKGPSHGKYLKAERKELGITRSEHDRQRARHHGSS